MACLGVQNTSNSLLFYVRLKGSVSPFVCWLDLANAFGSVHYDIIAFSLAHYHAPPEMIQLVSNLYDGLTAVISTDKWTTTPSTFSWESTRVTLCQSSSSTP
jgi:hypothetical protein